MLARREGETLNALVKRLDKAIGRYYDSGETPDEINSPSDLRQRRQEGAAGHSRMAPRIEFYAIMFAVMCAGWVIGLYVIKITDWIVRGFASRRVRTARHEV